MKCPSGSRPSQVWGITCGFPRSGEMCVVHAVLLGHGWYLLFVYSKEVMSCGLFCILKIYPLFQSFYQGEKGQKNSRWRCYHEKNRNKKGFWKRGFQGVEVASIIRNKDEG